MKFNGEAIAAAGLGVNAVFFFSLHCRTSARHCRSTTGMSEERKQISPKAKANKNKHTNQTKQHPQKAKPGKNPGKFAS